jgi:SAM-dependent methyltransferase
MGLVNLLDGKEDVIDINVVMEAIQGIKLNIGCGTDIKPGFINIDPFSPFAEAPWDAGKLPFNDNSVALIYSTMTIEHFPMPRVVPILTEWYRVLRRKGKLIIYTSNIVDVCRKTIETAESGDLNLKYLFGSQTREGHSHFCGFTQESLFKCMVDAGFMFAKFASPEATWIGPGYHDLLAIADKE